MMKEIIITTLVSLAISFRTFPQQDNLSGSSGYIRPDDPLVNEKLEKWRDLKFGVIIHWGLYAVPGIVESWALCSEDWIERDSDMSYDDFKKWYWGIQHEFNPVNFDPGKWAQAAYDAGMKYVVFTTKHHDGFCMYDTKQTSFSIANGPFKDNPKADVARHVFEAFRDRQFMIGAYFSKPDWHSEFYWWPKYATPDRNNNYDIRKYPWRWEQFKNFTYNQISELMNHYEQIDILWLDGGWVRPLATVNDEVRSWGATIPEWSQDIDIPRIAAMSRKAQPGILIVDRTVHGTYENYRTPEQQIPQQQPDYPWESCITLGNSWGYVPGDKMKPSSEIIHTLIEVTAKGGNLLLGVGPTPQGEFTSEQTQSLKEIGEWLRTHGEAIYNTRTLRGYRNGNTFFTRSKEGTMNYAITKVSPDEGMPRIIKWNGNPPAKGSRVILLTSGRPVKWKQEADTTVVCLPQILPETIKMAPAIAFSFVPENKSK